MLQADCQIRDQLKAFGWWVSDSSSHHCLPGISEYSISNTCNLPSLLRAGLLT